MDMSQKQDTHQEAILSGYETEVMIGGDLGSSSLGSAMPQSAGMKSGQSQRLTTTQEQNVTRRKKMLCILGELGNMFHFYPRTPIDSARGTVLINQMRRLVAGSDDETIRLTMDALMMTPESFAVIMAKRRWIFAKTMSANPHHYTLLKDYDDPITWFALVAFIEKYAVTEKFYKKSYQIYYGVDGFKYWFMDPTVDTTDLINRKKV